MKTTNYEYIYILDIDAINESKQADLLMCGSHNWDHYFVSNSKKANNETLTNVDFIEFENHNEFEDYINSNQIIDYSLEHKKPMVLVHGKS